MVESLPANAGDTGSYPGLGGSHMLRSNWAREPQLLSLRVWSLCSATREATIVRGPRTAMRSGPRSPQLEEALAQKRRSNTAKKNKNKNKNKDHLEMGLLGYGLCACSTSQEEAKLSPKMAVPICSSISKRRFVGLLLPTLVNNIWCSQTFEFLPMCM